MSVFLEIFDYLFADNLSLEPAQRRLDRFVIVTLIYAILVAHLLSAKILHRRANNY